MELKPSIDLDKPSREDGPTGYFGCCGASRYRGHHEGCPKLIADRMAHGVGDAE